MEEQKRLFIAIILSIVVILGWNTLFVEKETITGQNTETAHQRVSPGVEDSDHKQIKDYTPEDQAGAVQPGTGSEKPPPLQPSPDLRTISLSTPLYNIEISENRAEVTSLTLKDYRETSEKNSPLKEMVSTDLPHGLFGFDTQGKTIPGLESAVFTAQTDADHVDLPAGQHQVTFRWESTYGIVFEKIYTFSVDTYLIDLDFVIKNGSEMPFKDSLEIVIPGIIDEKSARFAFEGPTLFLNNELQEVKVKNIEDQDTYAGKISFAGVADRYFISCIAPEKPVDARVKLAYEDPRVKAVYIQSMERIDPGKQVRYAFKCFMGPKSLKVLDDYGYNLKKSVNFGWFDILAKPCLIGMNLIYDFIPNYGVAIIILTILIKLVFWPLGTKSYKSMNDMKKIQPLMMEIREKYKGDKQKMNAEVMSLYKTYKVNPMSGCLPMLVQMPIFFALYRMLYQAIELRHAPFMGWITDLSAPDRLFHFDVAIPFMQAPAGIPVLTIIMGATMFLQQKMSPSTGDPTQAKIMMLMPLFMTFIFINFPAGLVLYWLVNNILSISQQYYIQKKLA
ncbi:MAG: membrane protein insertase YidC [Thermodesulfobacteriota bacterium]|nr:membrane protein insertase YidC [Thermodesulfobacteriota bacterium]